MFYIDWKNIDFIQAHFWRPFVGLCLAVAKADGNLDRLEVRIIKDFLTNELNMPISELSHLKKLMKTEPSLSISDLVYTLKIRAPNIEGIQIITLLTQVAKVDGGINELEIKSIKNIANIWGITDSEWKEVSIRLELNIDKDIQCCLELLNLSSPTNEVEIKKAYRIKIRDFHPDKYHNQSLPDEVIKIIHEKATELTLARDKLLDYYCK